MAHGTPDWGQTAGSVTVYQMTDLGELAVRLGSPVSHDRRGDVVWWDDFEWGLAKWIETEGGTGASVALSTAAARNGRCSVLLTAGSDGDHQAAISHYNPFAVLGRMGVEISFRLASSIDNFRLSLILADGADLISPAVRWDDVTNVLQYRDSTGAWVTIASGLQLSATQTLFNTLKLVADFDTQEYVRVILNETEYPLAGVAVYAYASPTTPSLQIVAANTGRSTANDTVYVDDAILTQNEPA